jgi:dipeptidyl aminopeptidase/acylaminoacyl peptidase
VDFDPQTQTFGEPQMVVDAPAKGKSITLPRVSPDGRYVLYTEGDYGQFHIWHKSSDLWVKDLQADTCYALKPANSKDVDSYHTWSSNGRWIVFSSRRDDGNYTRPYIAYFDKNGKARKAFMLPHEDPEYTLLLLRSYNVPELTTDAVTIPASELRECIYDGDGEKAKYTK